MAWVRQVACRSDPRCPARTWAAFPGHQTCEPTRLCRTTWRLTYVPASAQSSRSPWPLRSCSGMRSASANKRCPSGLAECGGGCALGGGSACWGTPAPNRGAPSTAPGAWAAPCVVPGKRGRPPNAGTSPCALPSAGLRGRCRALGSAAEPWRAILMVMARIASRQMSQPQQRHLISATELC